MCVYGDTTGETHLRGTTRRRWSGDIEPGTAEVPPSVPEPQSNLQQFLHRRSSWHKSESTWGRKQRELVFLYIHALISVSSVCFRDCCPCGSESLCVYQCFLPTVHWPALFGRAWCYEGWLWWKGQVSISFHLLPAWQWSLLSAAMSHPVGVCAVYAK